MIARSARTSQSSHDLEAMLREFRCIQSAQEQVTFYGLQRAHLTRPRLNRVAGASGEQGIKHYDVGISTISDNYISDVLINHYDTHEVCAPAIAQHCVLIVLFVARRGTFTSGAKRTSCWTLRRQTITASALRRCASMASSCSTGGAQAPLPCLHSAAC